MQEPKYAYGHYTDIPPIEEELTAFSVPEHTQIYLGHLVEALPLFDLGDTKVYLDHEKTGTAIISFHQTDQRMLFAFETNPDEESGWVHVKGRGCAQILEDGPLEGTDFHYVLSLMFKEKEGDSP